MNELIFAFVTSKPLTVPMISPLVFLNLVLGMISSFQVFTVAYIATKGGPVDSTLFYVLYLYHHGFQNFRMGLASAMAWVLFAIIVLFTLIQFRMSRHWVYYESGASGTGARARLKPAVAAGQSRIKR